MKRPAIMIPLLYSRGWESESELLSSTYVGAGGGSGGKLRRAASFAMDGAAVDDAEDVDCIDDPVASLSKSLPSVEKVFSRVGGEECSRLGLMGRPRLRACMSAI